MKTYCYDQVHDSNNKWNYIWNDNNHNKKKKMSNNNLKIIT